MERNQESRGAVEKGPLLDPVRPPAQLAGERTWGRRREERRSRSPRQARIRPFDPLAFSGGAQETPAACSSRQPQLLPAPKRSCLHPFNPLFRSFAYTLVLILANALTGVYERRTKKAQVFRPIKRAATSESSRSGRAERSRGDAVWRDVNSAAKPRQNKTLTSLSH